VSCNALRGRHTTDPTVAVAEIVREAAPALLAFDDEDLEHVAHTCVKEIGKMTAALRELAGRMGYNPESEEGRKGFGELLARIAKVKTDACNIYDVPPPLMALKAIITYYQCCPPSPMAFMLERISTAGIT
jgi:hypothetical protein